MAWRVDEVRIFLPFHVSPFFALNENMKSVHIKESCIVTPAEETPHHSLCLSSLDLLHGNYHVLTVYIYKQDDFRADSSTNPFDFKAVKDALSKVLVPFYPVAGRLQRGENGRIEINCNGGGVLLVEAETDTCITDLGDFVPADNNNNDNQLRQLIQSVDCPDHDISSYPLLIAQVTKFGCGGVCLGIGLHHMLADGMGALHFINSWSSIARGLTISTLPVFDRKLLVNPKPEQSPTKFHHLEYDPNPALNQTLTSSPPSVAILTLTSDQLTAVKRKACKKDFTTFEVIAAHIWRCACKARGLANDQPTKLKVSVDGRSKLKNPPLPKGYFGNAVFFRSMIVSAGEILQEPIGRTAERIQKMIKGIDDEEGYLRSAIDYLEGASLDFIQSLSDRPESWKSPNLKINSWSRLPFYEADFGWGSPSLIKPLKFADGKVHLQPNPGNDGSLSLVISLESDHLQSFRELFYQLPD